MIIAPLIKIPARIGLIFLCVIAHAAAKDLPLSNLKLPEGFSISIYAEVENPRQLALAPNGVVYAASRRAGKVHAVIDADQDFVAERVVTIDKRLNLPSGLALKDGDLYVGAVNRILVYRDIGNHLDKPPKPEVLYKDLPKERHHGWKYLDFGPDGLLYFNVGAPCNICLSDDPRFASIMRMDVNSKKTEIVAHGVRNTVGFTWHPVTKELWFTDNGRDWLGDDSPPCELNRATADGQHFGYPFVHGNDILDPEFGDGKSAGNYVAPALELGAHVAPLGLKFYTGDMLPKSFHNQILIAEHGSWNRSPEAGHVGHRITMARLQDGKLKYETLIDGWLQNNVAWGRPVDLLQMPDGSLLISDDTGNVIYRVTYNQ